MGSRSAPVIFIYMTVLLVATGCIPPSPPEPGPFTGDTLRIREGLKAALIRYAPSYTSLINKLDARSLHARPDTSAAISGLVYYWTSYSPPRTADLFIEVVVAAVDESVVPLQSASDWEQVMRLTEWHPHDPEAARNGCADLVRTTSRFRSMPWPTAIYTDTAMLRGRWVEGADALRARLSLPIIDREPAGTWRITAWFLEEGQATKYECRLGPGPAASFRELEILRGAGFPRRGP